jgi:enediyne core biosynthesis thioesterase
VRWQGLCREAFLQQYAPEIILGVGTGLALATTRVACSYYRELAAFDEVSIRMRLKSLTPNRLTMASQYFRVAPEPELLVAEGEQEVACIRRVDSRQEAVLLPSALREAVQSFTATETLLT